jgi:hypothetical protein
VLTKPAFWTRLTSVLKLPAPDATSTISLACADRLATAIAAAIINFFIVTLQERGYSGSLKINVLH